LGQSFGRNVVSNIAMALAAVFMLYLQVGLIQSNTHLPVQTSTVKLQSGAHLGRSMAVSRLPFVS
jgi:hypothetical protein